MSEDQTKGHAALVVMDVQRTTVTYIGDDQVFLNRLVGAIETARKAEMMVW